MKDGKSELAKIQKHRDDVLKELDKVKQDQDDIEKKCSKLCELKDNVIYFFFQFSLIDKFTILIFL